MKVIFSNKIHQGDSKDGEPELVDGIAYRWIMKSELMKIGETFQQWLVRKEQELKDYEHTDVVGVVVHNFQPVDGVPILEKDNKYYGKGAMIIRYAWLKHLYYE